MRRAENARRPELTMVAKDEREALAAVRNGG
jgi:hypothetical protein